MAIIKTCKISVYALANQINEITEFLHKSQIIEPAGNSGRVPERVMQNIDNELKRTEAAICVWILQIAEMLHKMPGFRGDQTAQQPGSVTNDTETDKHTIFIIEQGMI